MSTQENRPLAEYSLISDSFIFVTLTIIDIYVLAKLRFNLDFSGKITLLLHFIVSGIRISYSYTDFYSDW
jgi:hypothetical protein